MTFHRRSFEHRIEQQLFYDRTEAACAGILIQRLLRNSVKGGIIKRQLNIIKLERFLELLDNGVFRLNKNAA